jgi:hypothetical protein
MKMSFELGTGAAHSCVPSSENAYSVSVGATPYSSNATNMRWASKTISAPS